MAQRWIDNWRTTTIAAISSTDEVTLDQLVAEDPLFLLEDALSHSAEHWCELTLDDGEGGIEVLKVDGSRAVVRAWTTEDALDWPEGSLISARLTARALRKLQELAEFGGLTRANLIEKLEGGHAGMGPALFWADADLGAYARFEFGRSFSGATNDTHFDASEDPGYWDTYEGYARLFGNGLGTEMTRFGGVGGINTGSTATGSCLLEVGPPATGIYAAQPSFSLSADPVSEIDVRLGVRTPWDATSAEDYNLEWSLSVPGLGLIWFRQSRSVNSGNLTITYKNASNVDTTINTSTKQGSSDRAYCVNVVPAGGDYTVEIAYRPNIASDTGKVVLATLNASAMAGAAVQFGYTAKITKVAGTTSRGLQVKRFAAKLTLQ
ncbi:hypothetical protein M2318_002719 [Metapseudomonas resinovorans]|uniref:hypothetical protein n=1 Tax=Metapseudomonas resinovorans TaxID=53412 RepID=UPI003D241990